MDRKLLKSFIGMTVTLAASPVMGDDIGGGRGHDIPISHPGDTIDAQGDAGFWRVLAELFYLDDETQQ